MSKTATEVVQAYVYNILSDNGTEFKNSLFENVAKQLRDEIKVYMTPYHPH